MCTLKCKQTLKKSLIELQNKYYDIIQEKDGRKLMQLMAPIWRLATYITQHMGWNCKEIIKLGLNIDYDDDLDKEGCNDKGCVYINIG